MVPHILRRAGRRGYLFRLGLRGGLLFLCVAFRPVVGQLCLFNLETCIPSHLSFRTRELWIRGRNVLLLELTIVLVGTMLRASQDRRDEFEVHPMLHGGLTENPSQIYISNNLTA